MSAPAAIIRLELERQPVLYFEGDHEGDVGRFELWLESNPAYAHLLADALELAEERAA